MSIIAIRGVPFKFSMNHAKIVFSKVIGGPHEFLNFKAKGNNTKILYIRLSERLDPVQVVDKLNSRFKPQRFVALIPEHVPDLPVMGQSKFEKNFDNKMKKGFNKRTKRPHEVAVTALQHLSNEIQFKYPGLFNLSRKTDHKLLDEIIMITSDRIKTIMEEHNCPDSFDLTKCYRKLHPHSNDFCLIVNTLHKLQKDAGAPLMPLKEQDLAQIINAKVLTEKTPLRKIRKVCTDYSFKVAAAMSSHIEGLDCKVAVGDDEETIARKKVREEMKKMVPYLPAALKQIVTAHFSPDDQPHSRIRIYGEPYLPNRDAMAPFTRPYVPLGSKVTRVRDMYNLIIMKVEPAKYAALRAMDSTVVSGAKILIRDSDVPIYPVSEHIRTALAAHWGGAPPPPAADEPEHMSGDDES